MIEEDRELRMRLRSGERLVAVVVERLLVASHDDLPTVTESARIDHRLAWCRPLVVLAL